MMLVVTDGLRRELGPWDAISVVVGAIVGVGIFFTASRVAALTGSDTLFLGAWLLGSLVALFGAMTFAELGSLYSRTGGQYEILRDAYGPAIGFVHVLCSVTAIQAGAIGIIAIVCVQNTAVLIGGRALTGWSVVAAACMLSVIIAVANAAGVRHGARIQNVTVVAKLAALLAVVAVALWVEPATPPLAPTASPSDGGVAGLAAAMVPVLFAFGGWQFALWLGGEIREPARNVPRAILVGVVIVSIVYLGTNWAYLRLLGLTGVAGSPALAADAVSAAVGDAGRRLVAAAVVVSALGVLNAQLLGGPRLLLALACDGRFFRPFARVHARLGTPVPAIALLTGAAVVLLVIAGEDGLDRLLTGVVMIDAVFFGLTGLASVVLLRRHPRATRPIRMPGFPVIPIMFVLAEVGLIVGAWMDPRVRGAAVLGVAWIAAAALLYALRFRRRRPDAAPPG
jgi:basic amino acid/polyamine antiporter, APA family